jgi:hypothetical protein
MALLPLIHNGVVALVMIALLLSSSWHHALIAMVSLSSSMSLPLWLVGKLASPPSMRRHLCRCCNGNYCSRHNGVVAVVDAQACLCRCPASVVTLAACRQAGGITHISIVLLPSMRRVFAVDTIAIFALITIASLPLPMHRRPCHCGDGVFALVTMACPWIPGFPALCCPGPLEKGQNNWQIC